MIVRRTLLFILLIAFAAQLVVARSGLGAETASQFWKRRGGSSGGSGGRSGGGSSGGKGGNRGSGSSSGGSGGMIGSNMYTLSERSTDIGIAPKNSPSSNNGGRTVSGSGSNPYIGGKYYPGGATVPYTAGARTASGLSPVFIAPLAVGSLWPGLWLGGAYGYYYPHPIVYHNATRDVTCLCTEYEECGCDENTDSLYIDNLPSNITKTTAVNGTGYLLINGTLENATTASGGSDGYNSSARVLRAQSAGLTGWAVLVSLIFAFELVL
ncbi:glycine-rich protein [Lipomyces starkeyi]